MDSEYAFINTVWAVVVGAVLITASALLFQGITASDALNADYKVRCLEAGGSYVPVDEDETLYSCKLPGEKKAE